jgi:hypothetical protein
MAKLVSRHFAFASLAAMVLMGCVDARGAYDEYGDRFVDASTHETDGQSVDALPDVSGKWLMAVHAPNLPEDKLILFEGTLVMTPVTVNTAKMDLDAQPLAVADHSPVGDAFAAKDRNVASDASFVAPLNGELPAEANPLGAAVQVTSQIHASIKNDQFLCGTMTGTAGPLPLDGTTWAAVRITGDTLPTPLFACDQQP